MVTSLFGWGGGLELGVFTNDFPNHALLTRVLRHNAPKEREPAEHQVNIWVKIVVRCGAIEDHRDGAPGRPWPNASGDTLPEGFEDRLVDGGGLSPIQCCRENI